MAFVNFVAVVVVFIININGDDDMLFGLVFYVVSPNKLVHQLHFLRCMIYIVLFLSTKRIEYCISNTF